MLRSSCAAAAFAASLIAASSAHAAEPVAEPMAAFAPALPNVRAAVAVGALAMLVPGVLGGTRAALGADDGQKVAGLLVASGGFALAPIFSHMIVREWGRAAAFGALPAAATIAATVLVSQRPDAVYRGTTVTRSTFGILFGLGLIGAVVGLIDTAMAGERVKDRARPKGSSLFVLPAIEKDGAMLTVGGLL